MKNLLIAFMLLALATNRADELDPREISIKIKNATDPNAVFQNAKTYLIKQKIEVTGGKKATFETEIKFKAPDILKTSYYFKGNLMNAILMKDDKIWKISGVDNKHEEVTGIELQRFKLFHDVSSPQKLLCDIFSDIKIEKVKINDENLYKIFCSPANEKLPQITFFVGEGDFLQRRMLTTNEHGEPFSAEILKYSLIENVFVPAETRVLSGGIEQKIILEQFAVNIELSDEEFKVNAE